MSLAIAKKKLRDTLRTLKRPNLTAIVKSDLERRVKALELEIASFDKESKIVKLKQKYKYVKFVEKQKIERKLAQCSKTDDASEQEYKLKLEYVNHYPVDIKYISILAPELNQDAKIKRDCILAYIKNQLDNQKDLNSKSIVSGDIFKESEIIKKSPSNAAENSNSDDFFL